MLKTFFLNSDLANYGEEEFNYIQKFLLQQGILNTQGADYNDFIDLKATQNGGGNMSLNVGIGTAILNTTRNSVSFKVFISNLAVANLAITNNTSGSNRVDAVILKLARLTEPDALMSNVATLQVVVGSGVSALSDGAIQTAIGADYDFIRLANITVANNATKILTASIADTRVRCYSTDASVPNPTIIKFRKLTSDPSVPAEGELWYNTTTNELKYYNGLASVPLVPSLGVPTGSIFPYAMDTAPNGYLTCDGSAVSRAAYPDLYTLLGDKYGWGNGSTTFNLPNLKSRMPYGVETANKVQLSDCESAWTAGSNVVASLDAVDFKQGTKSVKLAVASGAVANQILGYSAITSRDLRGKTKVGFWFKSDIALSAGDLKFQMDDTAGLSSPIEAIALPAIEANKWTKLYLTLATSNLDSAIISIGLYQIVDKGAFNCWIDDVAFGENYESGALGGETTHELTVEELASHNHTFPNRNGTGASTDSGGSGGTSGTTTTSNAGSNTPHNNLPPFISLNYIIKY